MPAPEITDLRERRDRVDVELDGRPWRTLPVEVAAHCSLVQGRQLDRRLARALARELRRHRALRLALRSLRSRDRSVREVEKRLADAAVPVEARVEAVAALERGGILDDRRFAHHRAHGLAARGWGDAAIRADLEGAGVAPERINDALGQLEPERARADGILAARGASAKTARYLAARGFEPELVADVAATAAVAAEG